MLRMMMIALFKRFPALEHGLPYVSLGQWPTPVRRLSRLGDDCHVYIKNDGTSGPLYGGNKVRKLEFLLADAIAKGRRELITFGVAGSNHALATSLYAESVGLRCICILSPQSNARYVARNLLAGLSTNAELHHYPSETAAMEGASFQRQRHLEQTGVAPMLIPAGGSSALGTVGFVNAGCELAQQIADNKLPEPDRIYVALGTMGTAAGLLLGLRACGVSSQLVPIRVVRDDIANIDDMQRLYNETNNLLHRIDDSFPLIPFEAIELRHDQYGQRYAVFTEAGMEAKSLLWERENIALEGTYTAKTMAALLADLQHDRLAGLNVLYWHTYNAVDLGPRTSGLDYHDLPADFHSYFERPVQPLDE